VMPRPVVRKAQGSRVETGDQLTQVIPVRRPNEMFLLGPPIAYLRTLMDGGEEPFRKVVKFGAFVSIGAVA